jgi:hypothetical protein
MGCDSMSQPWFTSNLSPKTAERALEFYLRKIVIAPLTQVPTQSKLYKYFLPTDNPKGKVLGFTIYTNMDFLEEGVVKDGLFKISMKLIPSKNNPAIKYVHVHLVDLDVEPENVKDTVTKTFYLSYATTEFIRGTLTRRGKLIIPDPQDLVVYLGVDTEIKSESTSLDYYKKTRFEAFNYKQTKYIAFISEEGIKHQEINPVILPVRKDADIAKDVELLMTLARFGRF